MELHALELQRATKERTGIMSRQRLLGRETGSPSALSDALLGGRREPETALAARQVGIPLGGDACLTTEALPTGRRHCGEPSCTGGADTKPPWLSATRAKLVIGRRSWELCCLLRTSGELCCLLRAPALEPLALRVSSGLSSGCAEPQHVASLLAADESPPLLGPALAFEYAERSTLSRSGW